MTQDTTTMPVMASDTAALVEAMARALAESEIRKNRRHDTPAEQVEAMIADGVVEWSWQDWIAPATAAYNALRDTLVPVVWLYERPGFRAISEDRYPPGVMANAVSTATESPLFALPELKP